MRPPEGEPEGVRAAPSLAVALTAAVVVVVVLGIVAEPLVQLAAAAGAMG